MKCKRQRGEREEFWESKKMRYAEKKNVEEMMKTKKKEQYESKKKSCGYVNVKSESSDGERRYNVPG